LKDVSLAEARGKAAEYRKVAKAGGDPIAEKRKAARAVPTFEEAARLVHAEHAPGWRNPKHAAQWINTLRDYAFPAIGGRRVDQLDTPDILRVLAPIWLTKPENGATGEAAGQGRSGLVKSGGASIRRQSGRWCAQRAA
jgi:hypothetical protein